VLHGDSVKGLLSGAGIHFSKDFKRPPEHRDRGLHHIPPDNLLKTKTEEEEEEDRMSIEVAPGCRRNQLIELSKVIREAGANRLQRGRIPLHTKPSMMAGGLGHLGQISLALEHQKGTGRSDIRLNVNDPKARQQPLLETTKKKGITPL
jgi:hypothetical protein